MPTDFAPVALAMDNLVQVANTWMVAALVLGAASFIGLLFKAGK